MHTSKGKKWYYANGFQLAQCRKMCEFYFDAFYFRADADEHEMEFNIHVYSSFKDKDGVIHKIEDYVDIERFQKVFCEKKAWNLIILEKN